MAWMRMRCSPFTGRSLSRSWHTLPAPDGELGRLHFQRPRGSTSAADRQRLDAFICPSKRSHSVPPDLPKNADLRHSADEKLFREVTANRNDVLHNLLSPPSQVSQQYKPLQRRHHLELFTRISHLTDCNFIQSMPYISTATDFVWQNYTLDILSFNQIFIVLHFDSRITREVNICLSLPV